MPNLTTLTLASGAPGDSGVISTLDAVMGTGPKTLTDLATAIALTNTKLDELKADVVTATGATGAGASGATTPRTIEASDSPLVVAIGAKTDAAVTNPATDASIVAYIRGWLTGLGAVADTAWTTGSGSVIALLKAIAGGVVALGQTTSAASLPTVEATDSPIVASLSKFSTGYYVDVAASATATVLQSSSGATGDYISGVLVIPETASPGNVLLLDNSTSVTIFAGGASSVSNLVPFFIPMGAVSRSGAWKITTGTNVHIRAIGKFS